MRSVTCSVIRGLGYVSYSRTIGLDGNFSWASSLMCLYQCVNVSIPAKCLFTPFTFEKASGQSGTGHLILLVGLALPNRTVAKLGFTRFSGYLIERACAVSMSEQAVSSVSCSSIV